MRLDINLVTRPVESIPEAETALSSSSLENDTLTCLLRIPQKVGAVQHRPQRQ